MTESHSPLEVAVGVDDGTIPAAQFGSGVPLNDHVAPVVPLGTFANADLHAAIGCAQPLTARFAGDLKRARTHDFVPLNLARNVVVPPEVDSATAATVNAPKVEPAGGEPAKSAHVSARLGSHTTAAAAAGAPSAAGTASGPAGAGAGAGPLCLRLGERELAPDDATAVRTLLDDVRELVRQEAPARGRLGRIAAPPEDDARAEGVRERPDRVRRRVGRSVVVHAHASERDAEPRLEERAVAGGERPAAADGTKLRLGVRRNR